VKPTTKPEQTGPCLAIAGMCHLSWVLEGDITAIHFSIQSFPPQYESPAGWEEVMGYALRFGSHDVYREHGF